MKSTKSIELTIKLYKNNIAKALKDEAYGIMWGIK